LASSYAYRKNKGARKAVNKVRHYIQTEKNYWLAKCDIDNFFDNVDHQRLRTQLKPYVKDNYLMELIFMFIKMGYVTHHTNWQDRSKGVPQGAVLSPLLANLYLSPLDQRMKDKKVAYVRYADDFVILTPTEEKAKEILDETIEYIREKLKLQLNPGAFVKHTQYGFKFLGVWITQNSITLSSQKIEKIKAKLKAALYKKSFPKKYNEQLKGIINYYAKIIEHHMLYAIDEYLIKIWHEKLLKDNSLKTKKQIKEQLQHLHFVTRLYQKNEEVHKKEILQSIYQLKKQKKITNAEQAVKERKKIYEKKAMQNTHLHIEGYGIALGLRKNHIHIKEKGKSKKLFPTYNLKHISIGSQGTSVSTKLIKFCADHNIAVDFVDNKGIAYAKIYHYQSTHHRLWIKQMQIANSKLAFTIAQSIVLAKLNNQLKLIKYFSKYAKQKEKDVKNQYHSIINSIEQIISKVKNLPYQTGYNETLMGYEGASSQTYWKWVQIMLDEETDFKGRITQNAPDLVNQMLNYGYAIVYRLVWDSVIRYGLHSENGFLHKHQKNKGTLIFDLIEPFRQPVVDRAVIKLINRKTKLYNPDGKLDKDTRQKLINAVYERLGKYDTYNKQRHRMIDIIDKQTQQLKLYINGQQKKFKPYKQTKW